MIIIGESIHIIAPKVRKAIEERDTETIQKMALEQVEGGAQILDLNIGPQKKRGVEIMPWLVDTIQDVVDVRLSLDTTNLAAIEAGLKRCKRKAIVNSTSGEAERLEKVPLVAAKYGAGLIALTMAKSGIPITAEERVGIAMEFLIPRAMEVGIPMEDLYVDPLALTVAGCQEYAIPSIETVRYLKQAFDPAPMTTIGLSNISNTVPDENRSLIDRIYVVMLMATGLDTAIANPLDKELNEVIRILEERDTSTPVGQLLVYLYDATAAMEELDPELVDMNDPAQADIYKTVRILMNEVIYADSYLRM